MGDKFLKAIHKIEAFLAFAQLFVNMGHVVEYTTRPDWVIITLATPIRALAIHEAQATVIKLESVIEKIFHICCCCQTRQMTGEG
jgi:hypothetical protein